MKEDIQKRVKSWVEEHCYYMEDVEKEELIKEIKNSDIVINKAAKIEHKLLQFDNHFKITTLRHGNTEN